MTIKRTFLLTIGVIAFGLGSVGTILPILPTTPFLLLAGYCFAHSSSRFHSWLQNTKIYNFYVADYAKTKAIPRRKKWQILSNIYILMGISVWVAPLTIIKAIIVGLMAFLTIMLFWVIPDQPS